MNRSVVAILLSVGLLVILTGAAYATRYDKAIVTGFSEPVTPEYTYIAGINFGGLDRESLEIQLRNHLDNISDKNLVIWLDPDEYYSTPLEKLGFDPVPAVVADSVFEKFPSGLGIKQVAQRHSGIRKGIRIDIPLELDEAALLEFLTEVKGNVDRSAQDAIIDFENQQLVSAHDGRKLDIDSTILSIPEYLSASGPVSLRPSIIVTCANVSSVDLESVNPTEPLATFTTKFNKWKRSRSKNIGKLAEMFRGVILQPGEHFSFNGVSGPRNRESGYFPAPEFKNNRIINGYGGGACQVSTTLYNTALLAGMTIDERRPHSRVVYYVPRGQDATVNYDSRVDLSFTNPFNHPVIIWPRYDIEEGWLTFDIYGHENDRREIEITNSYSYIGRTPEMDTYIVDKSLTPGEEKIEDEGTNGVRARTWRHIIQPDGSRITEDLFYDVIPAMGRIVIQGPGGSRISVASTSSTSEKASEESDSDGIYF
jgi:vancomycin resistance protein YoaR